MSRKRWGCFSMLAYNLPLHPESGHWPLDYLYIYSIRSGVLANRLLHGGFWPRAHSWKKKKLNAVQHRDFDHDSICIFASQLLALFITTVVTADGTSATSNKIDPARFRSLLALFALLSNRMLALSIPV